jgi:hypothetical protein
VKIWIQYKFKLNLEKIVLKNIGITYHQLPNKNYSAYNIKSLDASFNYWPDTIKCMLNSNIIIDEIKINSGFTMERIKGLTEISLNASSPFCILLTLSSTSLTISSL